MSTVITEERIEDELSTVLDPCSCKTERPVNIVDLGLVEQISITGESVTVELLLTSDACIYFLDMSEEIEDRLLELPGINDVEVEQETTQVWTPDRMAESEREVRRERFRELVDKHDLKPYTQHGD